MTRRRLDFDESDACWAFRMMFTMLNVQSVCENRENDDEVMRRDDASEIHQRHHIIMNACLLACKFLYKCYLKNSIVVLL